MMLLSGSKSRPQTCSAIIGRVSTRPTLRMKYSSSAYSRAVNATLRWPRVTSRVEGSSVRSARRRTGALEPLPDEARDLPLVLDDQDAHSRLVPGCDDILPLR